LIYLGAVRKILLLLTKGPLTVRLSAATVQIISYQLVELSNSITSDFARKCRSLSELCHWKGTELRFFILYIGPIVLKNILNTYLSFITH